MQSKAIITAGLRRRLQWYVVSYCISFFFHVLCDHDLTASPQYNNTHNLTQGWNTWCTDDACGLLDKCSDALVRSIADAIVEEGLDKLGYRFVNMDDCWSAKNRSSTGELQPDPERFPHGMKALADYVHSKNLFLGLYTCVGTYTCKNKLPGSAGHWDTDAKTLAGWGVDFVKADFCTADHSVPAKSLYANFSRALNETGREMVFSLCEWGTEDVVSWGSRSRTRCSASKWITYPSGTVESGQQVKGLVWALATLSSMWRLKPSTFVRKYGWLDPDFLETLFPLTMPFVNSRTEFSFWALWSAPLIVATDIRKLSPQKRKILTNEEVIAVDQDPLATAGDRISADADGRQVWAKPLSDGTHAVILFNNKTRGSGTNVTVTWQMLGNRDGSSHGDAEEQTALVRDLWQRKDLGTFTNEFRAFVHPRSALLKVA